MSGTPSPDINKENVVTTATTGHTATAHTTTAHTGGTAKDARPSRATTPSPGPWPGRGTRGWGRPCRGDRSRPWARRRRVNPIPLC